MEKQKEEASARLKGSKESSLRQMKKGGLILTGRESETRENNQNSENASSKVFLKGALIGGVVGAAAALLLAPKSGKELRHAFNSQASNLLEKSTKLRDEILDKREEVTSLTREKTASLSKAIIEQSTDLVNKVKNFADESNYDQDDSTTNYISIKVPQQKEHGNKEVLDETFDQEFVIRRKLAEAQKAFEEEESKMNF